MAKNSFKKFALLGVLASLGLCACGDEIIAKPTDYNEAIVTVEGYNKEIYNDIMSVIYDSIRDESIASDTLQEILYEYATSVVGKYNSISPDRRSNKATDTVTLKAAYEDSKANGGYTIVDKFIDEHKAYWSLKEDKTHDRTVERARVQARWNSIEERIAEKLHALLSSESYVVREEFHEDKLLKSLFAGLNKVENPFGTFSGGYVKLVDPNDQAKDVFSKYLHRDFYQSSFDQKDSEPKTSSWNTYVEDSIIPDIYRQLLVEQYLLDESYNALGGAYARKVNIIAIKENANQPKAAKTLANLLVNTISANPTGTAIDVDATDNNFFDEGFTLFAGFSDLMKGIDLDAQQIALLDSIAKEGGYEKFDFTFGGETATLFKGTDAGDLVQRYMKINDNPELNDSSIENEFTGDNSHTKEQGLELKSKKAFKTTYVTSGWFIKDGGLSSIPESIRSRIFNVGVANSLDRKLAAGEQANDKDRFYNDGGTWKYDRTRDYNNYVARINGKYFLKNDKSLREDDPEGYKDILFYDTDSSTYYVVQIAEATSTSKLNSNSTWNYSNSRSVAKMTEIVAAVAKLVGSGSSYETTSTKYWLDKAEIQYHDQVVYDYFNSNYPELFED